MRWHWNPFQREKRKHQRYDASKKVAFKIIFDFKTKVSYQIVDQGKEKILSRKYPGLSKDISAEGLCFISSQELQKGDLLQIDVFVPGRMNPIPMEGEVRWCKPMILRWESNKSFSTGVKLLTVNNKSVAKSIYFDENKQLIWSDVLDSIIGDILEIKLKKKDR